MGDIKERNGERLDDCGNIVEKIRENESKG